MSETNTQDTGSQGVTVRMSKLTEGIGILFSGVLTMLEALDAGTAKTLTEGFAHPDAAAGSGDGGGAAPVNTAADNSADHSGRFGVEPDTVCHPDGAGEDKAVEQEGVPATAQPEQETKPVQETHPTPDSGLTVDDVARIVVQKVKANPGINEKIRALVIAHGAQRVTELKPEVLEAFLTDLSQL